MLHVRKGSGQGQCLHLSLTEENMQHDDVTSKNDVNFAQERFATMAGTLGE